MYTKTPWYVTRNTKRSVKRLFFVLENLVRLGNVYLCPRGPSAVENVQEDHFEISDILASLLAE